MGMELEYIGDGRYVVGWPACDHYEPDDGLARAKISSGLYRPKAKETEEPKGKGGR